MDIINITNDKVLITFFYLKKNESKNISRGIIKVQNGSRNMGTGATKKYKSSNEVFFLFFFNFLEDGNGRIKKEMVLGSLRLNTATKSCLAFQFMQLYE